MLTSPTHIASRIGVLLAGLALLLTGCDSLTQQNEANKVTYEVTNDLGERLTVANDNGTAKTATPSAGSGATTFKVLAQVTPPDVTDGTERASFIHYGDKGTYKNLYAGYMIRGNGPANGFGGGVDIIDVSDLFVPPINIDPSPGTNALQVDGVDVQEIATTQNVLFLGVAEEESFDVGNTPSEVHSIHIEGSDGLPVTSGGTVEFEDRDLPGNLVKGVTNASSSDGTNDFYAVTDANTFHRFDVGGVGDIRSVSSDQTTGFPGVEFRGVAANKDGGWAMDDGGNVWRGIPSGGLDRLGTFSAPDFFGGSPLRSIARVSSPPNGPTCNGSNLVFMALNNSGFRVVKTGTSSVTEVYRNTSLEVTTVTATDDYVYVGSGSSIAVYSIDHSTLCNSNAGEGLRKIGKSQVRDYRAASNFDFSKRGQVNQIVARNISGTDYLFIAKGDDGVVIVSQDTGTYP